MRVSLNTGLLFPMLTYHYRPHNWTLISVRVFLTAVEGLPLLLRHPPILVSELISGLSFLIFIASRFWWSLGVRVSTWTRMICFCLNVLLRGGVYIGWCCRRRIAGISRMWSCRWCFCVSRTYCVRQGSWCVYNPVRLSRWIGRF